MRFRDLNWMDVEHYLEKDNRIILVTGSTEQHSYLSLSTDVRISEKIADAVTGREPVLIAPPINFGVSSRFMDFPGTISVAQSTFDALLTDMIQGLLRHGFTNFLILNGHEGNRFPESLVDFVDDDYTQIIWFDWWNSRAVQDFEIKHNLRAQHANWSENFAFNRVARVPEFIADHVEIDILSDEAYLPEQIGDGNLGGHYQIDDRLMFQLFDNIVEEVTQLLIEMRVG